MIKELKEQGFIVTRITYTCLKCGEDIPKHKLMRHTAKHLKEEQVMRGEI
jgi:uncharacterized CHY-type Zn-finger protein